MSSPVFASLPIQAQLRHRRRKAWTRENGRSYTYTCLQTCAAQKRSFSRKQLSWYLLLNLL